MTQKRNPGGQPGNQNARTHGFYSKSVKPEHREKLRDAADIRGLDQEIALLRLKIEDAARDSQDYRVLIPGISLLSRLLGMRQKLGYGKEDGLKAAFRNVVHDIMLPMGMTPAEISRMAGLDEAENGTSPSDLPPSGSNESASV